MKAIDAFKTEAMKQFGAGATISEESAKQGWFISDTSFDGNCKGSKT